MSQYQLVNREAPKLLSMPGLVDSHVLRSTPKPTVETPVVSSSKSEPIPIPDKKPRGRPKKTAVDPSDTEQTEVKPSAPSKNKKLDISKSKIF